MIDYKTSPITIDPCLYTVHVLNAIDLSWETLLLPFTTVRTAGQTFTLFHQGPLWMNWNKPGSILKPCDASFLPWQTAACDSWIGLSQFLHAVMRPTSPLTQHSELYFAPDLYRQLGLLIVNPLCYPVLYSPGWCMDQRLLSTWMSTINSVMIKRL